MRPRVHRPTLALRALTGLVTVWCLGCSAFESLLDGLVGDAAGVGMVCASEGDATTSAVASAAAMPNVSLVLTGSSKGDEAPRGVTCGCQQCLAPPAAALVTTAIPAAPAGLLIAEPSAPASVDAAPLVPPPQHRA